MSEEQTYQPNLAEAWRNFVDAFVREVIKPVMSAFTELCDALNPVMIEKRRRRTKMRQLRADFIRKRGLRR